MRVPVAEYESVRSGAGLFDRSSRGLVVLTGRDRRSWLHNLVTNDVKGLPDTAGCYAFAIDVRGRVQFDLNILARPGALWLDIDAAAIPGALAHLRRYKLAEDVALDDATGRHGRLGVAGPRSAEIAAALGARDLAQRRPLDSVALGDGAAVLVRHDFAGLLGFEWIGPAERLDEARTTILARDDVVQAGPATLDVLRIEAGIPWWGRDIDERTLPPETGQVERGISYHKGCYLGQEVIERMRSHNVLAKRLVKVRVVDGSMLTLPATLRLGDADAGRITSLAPHPAEPWWVGLAYLRTAIRDPSGLVAAGDVPVQVV